MNQATLTPKYINQVKPGKKMGTIKDKNSKLWMVEPGLLGSFSPGVSVTVEYERMKPFSDGTIMDKITGVVHGAAPQTNGAAPNTNNNTGREIFITGVVGRSMGSGKFAIADLTALTTAAMAAWEVASGHPARTPAQPDEGLNDAVPF